MHESEERQLVRFAGIEEIEVRPAFCREVPADRVTPTEAVGVYHFPRTAKQPCGLSNCRTPHSKGFLVAMDTGEEALIGGYCGAKKMGLAFQEVINRAQRLDRIHRYRETLRRALAESRAFYARLEAILDAPYGARWLSKRMSECSRVLPSEALHLVQRMARHRMPDVSAQRPMTASEVAVARETGAIPKGEKGPFFRSEKIGIVAGLDIWRTDLRALLIDDMQQGMQKLQQANISTITSEATLRAHARWVESLPSKFAEAEILLRSGSAFFEPDNLRLLTHLSTAEREIKGLQTAIDRLRATAS